MPNKQIKPCPICGERMKLKRMNRTVIKGKTTRNTYCYCPTCDLRGPRILYRDFETKEKAELQAIVAMNRRAD